MKTRETTPGRTYSVHTSSGCTVSDKNGWSKTIDAPDGYFTAHAGEVTIDGDDAADVREVFKLAPWQKLALLGVLGGGTSDWTKTLKTKLAALLDGSKFELDWIADENTLVVHTDRVSDELLAAVKATAEAAMPATATLVQYNHHIEVSWSDINKYAACRYFEDMVLVDPEKNHDGITTDFTSTGEWHYPLPAMLRPFEAVSLRTSFLRDAKNETLTLNLPKLKDLRSICARLKYVKHLSINAPSAIGAGFISYPEGSAFESCSCCVPKATSYHWSFYNNTKLKNFYIESINEKAVDFENIFHRCQLNRDSVIDFCNKLPICSTNNQNQKVVTLGVHVDHKNDEEVLAAITNAEAKGWSLTVQWNGTPTSTASTMAMGQLIYAKVGEQEMPDGTTERVMDWGHYVTDETGYETFRSLASAYRYFGIPMPAETLTETE